MEYFFADSGQQRGPLTLEQLSSMDLRPETLVWHEGLPEWMPASTFPELAAALFASQRLSSVPAASGPLPSGIAPLAYQGSSGMAGGPNGMATASMVLGILALITMVCDGLGLIPGILAIIFGVVARNQIRRSDAQGYGMATAGLICGSIAVGLIVLAIIVIVAAVTLHN